MDLICQNKREMLEEKDTLRKAEEIKEKRLKCSERENRFHQKQNAASIPEKQKQMAVATPEELDGMTLKNSERDKRQNQKSKEKEAMKLKRSAQNREYRKKRLEQQKSILRKAMELRSQNQLLSIEEKEIVRKAEEVKALRLRHYEHHKRYIKKREATATFEEKEARRLKKLEKVKRYCKKRKTGAPPEKIEAMRLKKCEQMRRYLQKRKAAATPEEMEAMRLKKCEQMKQCRQKRKVTAKPEEKEAMRLKKLEETRQYRQNKREKEGSILRKAMELLQQNQEMSSDDIELLKLAEKIKDDRLRKNKYRKDKRNNSCTVKEREKAAVLKKFKIKTVAGWLNKDQVIVFDEVKIEKEVLQETKIKAISARQDSNLIQHIHQGGYIDSSYSWLDISEKSFKTGETSRNQSYFQSFHGGSSSIQFDRRKLGLEKSFRCMRVLIDATAKPDGHAIFGEQIAQKLRSSEKNVAEVNIAKQLIDNILQNLAIGAYSFETKIV